MKPNFIHMKLITAAIAFSLCLFTPQLRAQQPTLYFQLFMHCEEPHVPDTPNFSTMTALQAANATSTSSYIYWRNSLKTYADMCADRGIKLNYQSDWNFLEGVYKWEVTAATRISGIMTNTGGLNIIQYLESRGHEVDAHSHQGNGYSYADVAWLVTRCGGTSTRVAGGHRLDPTTFQALDFAQLTNPAGVAPTKYTTSPNIAPTWFPRLLMGGASTSHENDPHVSGIWRPASATNYFAENSSATAMPSIGGWHQDLNEIEKLMSKLESGELATGGQIWTASYATNHRDIVVAGTLEGTIRATLDTLKRWQDAGRIQSKTFTQMLDVVWPTNFSSTQHLYQRPADNASISLNWQEFQFKARSAQYLETILDAHEANRVPLDVFFTTWQTDIIADEYPTLMARLLSSSLVAQGYHLRAPKPYVSTESDSGQTSDFEWGELRTNTALTDAQKRDIIENYESYRLDPLVATNWANAMPDTSASGGFARITALQGYAPLCTGANGATSPVNLSTIVNDYFHDPDDSPANGANGTKMFVRHGTYTNLGTRWTSPDSASYPSGQGYLFYRPEHYDWKLITLWKSTLPDYAPTFDLDDAIAGAHSSGGRSPWFIGIKLHDNDLFAQDSAWTQVWPNYNQSSWNHAILNTRTEFDAATQSARLSAYLAIVTELAARRTEVNLMNSFDTLSMQAAELPRPIGLTRTKIAEAQPTTTTLATLSGGGTVSGQTVTYTLVAGTGDTDNADFSITGNELKSTRLLNSEAKPVRQFRVRWSWIDALDNSTVLASGERALTLVLTNVNTDDDDGDGFTEEQEGLAGTDPQNPASRLVVTGMQRNGNDVTLTWSSINQKSYIIQSSTDLSGWTDVVSATANSASTTRTFTVPQSDQRFFRIKVVSP